MKSSAVAHSGMPSGHKYMGWWGDMGGPKQKGIIQYSVSPFYQNTMHNAFRSYAFFGYKRLAAQLPYFALPIGLGYAIIAWGKSKNHYYNSKAGHLAHGSDDE